MRRTNKHRVIIGLSVGLMMLPNLAALPAGALGADYYLVSASSSGVVGDGSGSSLNTYPQISEDGRYVGFISSSSNLVPDDTNGRSDAFRKDTVTGQVIRLNLTSTGQQDSTFDDLRDLQMTSDGSKFIFSTYGTLVPEDTNTHQDVYVRDFTTGTIEQVSVTESGEQPDNDCRFGKITEDGQQVYFSSLSTNLVPGYSSSVRRIYHKDLTNHTLEVVNVPAQGAINLNDISADGRYLMYEDVYQVHQGASTFNWADTKVFDTVTATTELVNVSTTGEQSNQPVYSPPDISADGRYVAFSSAASNLVADDTDQQIDLFVRDRVAGTTIRASLGTDGVVANDSSYQGRISADGRYVVFDSTATNLAGGTSAAANNRIVYIRDLSTNQTRRVTQLGYQEPLFNYGGHTISSNGQFIAFSQSQMYATRVDDFFVSPATPENLTIASPTSTPVLHWDAVAGVENYRIYRDGVFINSTVNVSFSDNSASEGNHTYEVTAFSQSHGESDHSLPVVTVVDKTAPVVASIAWTANPVLAGQDTTLSVTVSEPGTSVSSVTYALDNGTPVAMQQQGVSGTWTATFGSTLPINTYQVHITAVDAANNQGTADDVLAVYSPVNGYVTGHEWLVPSAGDTLPIAQAAPTNPNKPPTKLVVGFTNVKSATTTTPTSGSFDISYVVKNNQDEFSVSSTSISSVVIADTSHASIIGYGDLTTIVGGSQSTLQNIGVWIDVALGANGAPDHITIRLYQPGVNPITGTPSWVINDDTIPNQSHLMIKQQ